ncbi:MAG: GH36 C-terminal domain-containing protein, partial [Agathobacter sp.]
TGRTTSLDFRGNVAMPLNFGYELDVTKMIEEEKSAVKQQVTFYKKHRTLIQYGDFYRLLSPFEGNDTGWITVAPDQTEAIAYYYQRLTTANPPMKRMKLTGLNPDVEYIVNDSEVVSGSQLMNYGVNIPTEVFTKDFSSYRIHIIQK